MLWKMCCFTLQSMGSTNHEFPVYETQSTVLSGINYIAAV